MWKKIVHLIEKEVDDARFAVEKLSGRQKPLQIQTYNGYGNDEVLRVSGRVLAQKNLPKTGATDSDWRNFINMARNWFTDEVPDAELEAVFQDETYRTKTDEEGYFHFEIPLKGNESQGVMWYEVELNLISPEGEAPVHATAHVQTPVAGSEFGIISDIDDTVIHTGATSLMEMAKNTLLGNAHTRVVFNGASALYAALARGIDGRGQNPFFYVTSSPWNLYNLISEIFDLRAIPRGTLFMKDWGIDENKFLKSGHHDHKKNAIKSVLELYPEMKFILIGDSGQEDPEIYTDILEEFSDRILALYIRDVTDDVRDADVRKLAEKAESTGVDLILDEESFRIAEHAVQKQFIKASEMFAISGQQKADRAEAIDDGVSALG